MSRLLSRLLKKQYTLPNSSTCGTIYHARHYAEDVAYTSEGLFTTEHEEMKRTLRKVRLTALDGKNDWLALHLQVGSGID